MNQLDKIYQDNKSPKEFAGAYLQHLNNVMTKVDLTQIQDFINLLIQKREQGKTIYFIGNGGSAATASHFANDLAIGTRTTGLKPFKVQSLTDNNAVMTALGNDDGYDQIFKRQLEIVLNEGDVLVAISASGNSPNLLTAMDYAKKIGAKTVSLTGFDGGKLKAMTEMNIHIPTDKGEYGPVEDAHMILDHLVGSYLNRVILEEKKNAL